MRLHWGCPGISASSRRRFLPEESWAGSVASAAAPLTDRARDFASKGQALGPSGGVGWGREEGEGQEAGPASGSGRELSRQGRKTKFTGAAPREGGGETPCKGSLWVLMTRNTGIGLRDAPTIAGVALDHRELEGGRTETPCPRFVIPKSAYIPHFP